MPKNRRGEVVEYFASMFSSKLEGDCQTGRAWVTLRTDEREFYFSAMERVLVSLASGDTEARLEAFRPRPQKV